MGAGQIGGIATLLDIDFENAAGFLGNKAADVEGQYVIYYLSHAVLFCAGALIEAHVVVTPAECVFGERYKFDVYAGSHTFTEHLGTKRTVENVCIHRGYNHSLRHGDCSTNNIALLVLTKQYSFRNHEKGSDFIINRVRYGLTSHLQDQQVSQRCHYYGWGSRRNGFLIPLSLELRRVEVNLLPCSKCHQMWNPGNKYLCVEEPPCKSEKYGALSPDDLGSVLVCDGFVRGLMTSRLMDRPAGIGFLDLVKYHKFLTCGVDGARDVIQSEDDYMMLQVTTPHPALTFATVDHHDASNVKKKLRHRSS